MAVEVAVVTSIEPGTIACLRPRNCRDRGSHRHSLLVKYGPASRMTENPVFSGIVAGLCNYYGLDWRHAPDSRKIKGTRGWSDFEIIGYSGHVYRELKGYHGGLTVPQRRMGSLLLAAGADWGTWRPPQLYDGTIEALLHEISRPPF